MTGLWKPKNAPHLSIKIQADSHDMTCHLRVQHALHTLNLLLNTFDYNLKVDQKGICEVLVRNLRRNSHTRYSNFISVGEYGINHKYAQIGDVTSFYDDAPLLYPGKLSRNDIHDVPFRIRKTFYLFLSVKSRSEKYEWHELPFKQTCIFTLYSLWIYILKCLNLLFKGSVHCLEQPPPTVTIAYFDLPHLPRKHCMYSSTRIMTARLGKATLSSDFIGHRVATETETPWSLPAVEERSHFPAVNRHVTYPIIFMIIHYRFI
jgi:hypothetical protein